MWDLARIGIHKRAKGERESDTLNDRYLKDVYKTERELEGDRERQNVKKKCLYILC